MGIIYKNLPEISVPDFATPDYKSKEVSVYYTDPQTSRRRRYVIGKLLTSGNMLPNDNFRIHHPDLWEQHYGQDNKQDQTLALGLYAATLAVSKVSGLYEAVVNAFGPEHGNAIMDYALYSVKENSNSLNCFPLYAKHNVTFSIKPKDSSWYSRMFNSMSFDEIDSLRNNWLLKCKNLFNINKVYLAIDGTNDDCKATNSNLAEKGKSKSGTSNKIVSQIWAVATEINLPVAWLVNNGNMTDAASFEEMIKLLAAAGIQVEGVILDRGFNSQSIIDLIESLGYDWVMMLKAESNAHKCMMEKHAQDIFFKVDKRVKEGGLFGISSQEKLYKNSEKPSYVSLYFSATNGAERFVSYLDKVNAEHERILKAIRDGKKDISVTSDYQDLIVLSKDPYGNVIGATLDQDKLQSICNGKGYFSIASSKAMDAKQRYGIYSTRDCVEKTFATKKSHVGHDALRAHYDEGIQARIACSFIACVIRSLLAYEAKSNIADTNNLIQGLAKIEMHSINDSKPIVSRSTLKKHVNFLENLGINLMCLNGIAEEVVSLKSNPAISQIRQLPYAQVTFSKKKRGRKKKESSELALSSSTEKKRPGRPAGSKNKKTLEREAAEANMPPKPPAKRGRPAGSKNKKTLEREAELAASKVKRGRGRPAGSKNKKTLEREAELAASKVKRGRGRPAGSKNKITLAREAAMLAASKRKPGRPAGSRNKTPEELLEIELSKRPRGRPKKGDSTP